MIEPVRTLGLVLAGGRAQRMGGDKAFVRLGGEPLAAYALARLRSQCDALAVSANDEPIRWNGFGAVVVADRFAGGAGPLAGVHAGLSFARDNGFSDVVTLPVDTPFAPADLVARLKAARDAAAARMATATTAGRRHHAVALWPASLAEEVSRAIASGERSVGRFSARFAPAEAAWPAEPFDPLFNVNTPDDLARAEQILRALRLGV